MDGSLNFVASQIQLLAGKHWVLWLVIPALITCFILLRLWWWRLIRQSKPHSPALYRSLTASMLLGLVVILAAVIDDLDAIVNRAKVISAFAVLMIAAALYSFYVAHRWCELLTDEHQEKTQKEVDHVKATIVANVVGLPKQANKPKT